MCGIFGLVCPPGEKPDPDLVQRATNRLAHRGPDDSGFFYDKNLALGNRRLAIIDLSDKGRQPLKHHSLTITFNGAIYNYPELRAELQKEGHLFKTETDTEVILAAYQQWGQDCVHKFIGMWAFAIHDPKEQILFCSRDRFGIKPFYYYQSTGTFAFASEIKAFQALPNWKAELNPERAFDYLLNGLQNHTSETLFSDVQQLLPGHHLIFDLKKHQFQTKQYYSINQPGQEVQLSFEEASGQFYTLLKDAVKLHSRSDVKNGAALSGGLDSSSIVALLSELKGSTNNNLEAVSYASVIPKYDESGFVHSLLQKYPAKVHFTGNGFEDTFGKIDEVILAHDEPLLSASLIAQYEVFKVAHEQGLKVMLDGQGADELLAGYGTYYLPFLKEIGPGRPFKLMSEIIGLLSKHQIKYKKKLSFFKKTPDLSRYLLLAHSTFSPKYSNFRAYSTYMIEKGILPYLLQFEDRNSMANSVESRVPFLDHRLVEFCINLPPEYKIKKGIRKAILRRAMAYKLPVDILNRYDKMGFTTPQEHWMSQHASVFLKEIQASIKASPGLFSPDLAEFAKTVFSKKQTEHYAFFWRVLTFSRWLKLYLVQY